MKILFKNDHIALVHKEAGWLSVPSRLGVKDLRPVVGIELGKELGKQVFPLHRLDFEVSGLMMFALSAQSHKILSKLWETHQIRKTYEAQTGYSDEFKLGQEYTWNSVLVRGKKRSFEAPHGKTAVTVAVLKDCDQKTSRMTWKLRPITGRSHQLRFELAKRGLPIVGDRLYGSTEEYPKDTIALFSIELEVEARQFLSLREKILASFVNPFRISST